MPGESGPVLALAPESSSAADDNHLVDEYRGPRMVSIVTSLPLENPPPVANAAPSLLRVLPVPVPRPNLRPPQLSKECLHLPRHVADIHRRTDDDRIGGREVVAYHFADDRFRTTLVPETAFAPSATAWAIFSVLPEAEW